MTAGKWWRLKVWHSVLMWWEEETGQFFEVTDNMQGQPLGSNAGDVLKEIFGRRAKKI